MSRADVPTFEIVHYRPDLKAQVIELQTRLWSPSASLNGAYFEWKYERNPYLQEPLIYLAMCDGQAVGMRGFFGIRWEAGNPTQRLTAVYADDTVIVPEHRNYGLMPRIMKTAFDDLKQRNHAYAFNLSGSPTTVLISLSTGWRSAGEVRPMRRRSWRAAAADRWSKKRKARAFADINTAHLQRVCERHEGLTAQEVPRCADMAALVERIGGSGRVRHVRDVEYFSWRFQNPLSRYRFLYMDRDRLQGYLVLQEPTSQFADPSAVNVVDWEASTDAIRNELLLAAVKLVGPRRMSIWSASLSAEAIKLLERSGFRPEKETSPGSFQLSPAILVRAIGEQADDWQLGGKQLTQLANWDLRMLYSMHG